MQRPCQSNNLVGAFAAVPCPDLPGVEALQAAQDARQAPREGSVQQPFTQSQSLLWTPRIPSGDPGCPLPAIRNPATAGHMHVWFALLDYQ